MKKIAFITTEFLSENNTHGGIGNYLYKMSKSLMNQGHNPEIFVSSKYKNEIVYYDGIKVHRVHVDYYSIRIIKKLLYKINLSYLFNIINDFINSIILSRSFYSANKKALYDIVQTPNYRYPGMFLSRKKNYKHYHRISSNRILFDTAEGREINLLHRFVNRMDIFCAKKADFIYAPSQYLADYLTNTYGLDVKVIRPPAHIGNTKLNQFNTKLPEKYFLHFGNLGMRKGTDLVAKALLKAWESESEIQMVFVGDMNNNLTYLLDSMYWGPNSNNVHILGAVEKKYIYDIVKRAKASVLLSRADNLPNTAIESLCLGTPVIGTNDSSIEEIVQHEVNGMLVSKDNIDQIADTMINVWNDRILFHRKNVQLHNKESFREHVAVQNFLNLSLTC